MSATPHIVLTRFNLAVGFSCKKRYDSKIPIEKPWLDEKYLEKRLEIFERYTLPSFQNQTDKDFKWIVMFHKDTPAVYKDRALALSRRMEQMEIWFLDDAECQKAAKMIEAYIAGHYADTGIITTRVDNDDAVHSSFISSIKKDFSTASREKDEQAGTQKPQILSYINGLQYDSRNQEIVKYHYANNHFLSLYVPNTEKANHILMYNHDKIDETVSRKQIEKVEKKTKIPLWVEIITETNYSNAPRWRFSAISVPYHIIREYPCLCVKWKNRLQWLFYVAAGIVKVFWYRGRGLFRIVAELLRNI